MCVCDICMCACMHAYVHPEEAKDTGCPLLSFDR